MNKRSVVRWRILPGGGRFARECGGDETRRVNGARRRVGDAVACAHGRRGRMCAQAPHNNATERTLHAARRLRVAFAMLRANRRRVGTQIAAFRRFVRVATLKKGPDPRGLCLHANSLIASPADPRRRSGGDVILRLPKKGSAATARGRGDGPRPATHVRSSNSKSKKVYVIIPRSSSASVATPSRLSGGGSASSRFRGQSPAPRVATTTAATTSALAPASRQP